MGRLVKVPIPDKKSGASKSWCREIVDTKEEVRTGYDIEGEWLARGEIVQAGVGSPVICSDQFSSSVPEVTLSRVKAPGDARVGVLEEVEVIQSRGWARALGPAIKRLLS